MKRRCPLRSGTQMKMKMNMFSFWLQLHSAPLRLRFYINRSMLQTYELQYIAND